MLEHLGLPVEAAAIMTAIESVTAAGMLTPDLGGTCTTREVGDAILAALGQACQQAQPVPAPVTINNASPSPACGGGGRGGEGIAGRHAEKQVVHADNLTVLQQLPDASVDLIYVDPPFNTGRSPDHGAHQDQPRCRWRPYRLPGTAVPDGRTRAAGYVDIHDDYLAFLEPRLVEFHRVLKAAGSLYFHIDYREAHYCKLLLDADLRARLLPERDHLGLRLRRSRRSAAGRPSTTPSWSTSRIQARYYFDADAVERIPYMAPGLVGPEKAARGKLPTDTWWHTIVPPDRQGAHRLPDARSRSAFCDGSCRRPHRLMDSLPISSLEAGRPARPAWSLAGASYSWTTTRPPSTPCAAASRVSHPSASR